MYFVGLHWWQGLRNVSSWLRGGDLRSFIRCNWSYWLLLRSFCRPAHRDSRTSACYNVRNRILDPAIEKVDTLVGLDLIATLAHEFIDDKSGIVASQGLHTGVTVGISADGDMKLPRTNQGDSKVGCNHRIAARGQGIICLQATRIQA